MRKLTFAVTYVLAPSILPLIFAFLTLISSLDTGVGTMFIWLSYMLTISGLYMFAKTTTPYQWLLPIGFILTPLPQFIFDYLYPRIGFFGQYFATELVIVGYTIPAVLISVVIVIIKRCRAR